MEEVLLLAFEAQDQIEQYEKVAAAVQNAIKCHCVIYNEQKKKKKKDLPPRHH